MREKIKKILVIRLSALGDTVHTIPAVVVLRDKFPNAQIDWVVEKKSSCVVKDNPLVSNIYVIDKKGERGYFKELFEIIRKIRNEKYDIAMDFQQLFKSGVILGLSGAKRRIALDGGREFSGMFANEIVNTGKKFFDKNFHVVKRNMLLSEYLGAACDIPKFILPEMNDYSEGKIQKFLQNINQDLKTVVIAPETTWEAKHAPVEVWQNIVKFLDGKVNLIYTGLNENLAKKIIGNANVINLCGQTDIKDLFCLFKKIDLLISLDSGSTHIAWACGNCKILSLFFATSAGRTAPYGDEKKYVSLSAELECVPCMKKKCQRKAKKNLCTEKISEDKIYYFLEKMI